MIETMKKQLLILTKAAVLLVLVITLSPYPVFAQERVFPEAPVLLEPPNGALIRFPGLQTPIPFSWTAVQGADRYEINVVVNSRPAANLIISETSVLVNLGLSIRESQTTVNWSVRALSGNQEGNLSETYSFKFGFIGTPVPGGPVLPTPLPQPTPTALRAPKLLSPEDGAIIESFSIEFDWEDVSGAASYRFTVYQNNEPYIQKNSNDSTSFETISWPNQETFQWGVRSIGANGEISPSSLRYSFHLGIDFLPTPTPVPLDPDFNLNGRIDAEDLYLFASSFNTNAVNQDFDNSGITTAKDLIRFLELYRAGHR